MIRRPILAKTKPDQPKAERSTPNGHQRRPHSDKLLEWRKTLPDVSRSRGTRRALALATVAAVALLSGLGFVGLGTREKVRLASQRAIRVAELRGAIAQLDDSLATTARIAAMSGERRWSERFEVIAPKLDAAIAEANEIATPEISAVLSETTGEAHRDLLTMERRVLALAADGDLATAQTLLDNPEFGYLQEVYADGLEVFGQDLRTLAEGRAADLDARAWMEAGGLGLIAVLLVSTALALRGRLRLRAAMARTAAAARTDPLTDLPNRRQFYEELEAALSMGRRTGLDHALLLIDLDRLKAVNDAYGHPAGDELLRLASARLRGVLADERRIARLGGDEFALVLRCDPAGPDQPQTDPAAVAERIIEAMAEPFALTSGSVQIGASVGIGLTRPTSDGMADLMHRADVALYRAKAEGRGCFRFFEQGTDVRVRALALLEGELRQAVLDHAVVPFFQPLVHIETGRLVGLEMLARWPHPTRGLVPPAEFVPIAEDAGLIGPMTVSLMRQGCKAAAAWPDHLTLACNISPLQLRDPGLPDMISAVLAETGFPARRLVIEVTESALVGDLALARTLLNENQGARSEARARRLRYGLLKPSPPPAPAVRQAQDRLQLRGRHGERPGKRQDRVRRGRSRSEPGHADGCRGRRDRGDGGPPSRARLRHRTGLALRPSRSGP